MAATQSGQTFYGDKVKIHLADMTSDLPETLSYNYASCPAALPVRAHVVVTTPPTSRCQVLMACDCSAGSAVNKTVPARLYGGDLAGAEADVFLEFLPAGKQALAL
jgi:hypothetical protein